MTSQLENRVALVTGSSSGIGAAAARRLAAEAAQPGRGPGHHLSYGDGSASLREMVKPNASIARIDPVTIVRS
jgi:NAD(P)-dependent dehydrogenase (short-subunit alcohol dehydrogenase family)